jgi:hypothetical protein
MTPVVSCQAAMSSVHRLQDDPRVRLLIDRLKHHIHRDPVPTRMMRAHHHLYPIDLKMLPFTLNPH